MWGCGRLGSLHNRRRGIDRNIKKPQVYKSPPFNKYIAEKRAGKTAPRVFPETSPRRQRAPPLGPTDSCKISREFPSRRIDRLSIVWLEWSFYMRRGFFYRVNFLTRRGRNGPRTRSAYSCRQLT